ncbi:MAG: zf-HC2 domain-containing protein [Chthonomonadales bacterium]
MRCSQAQPNLKAFMDGELNRLLAWRIRKHVAHCNACRTRIAELRSITRALGEADRATPPPGLRSRILDALPPPAPRLQRSFPRRYAVPAVAGAGLCAVIAVWVVWRHPELPTQAVTKAAGPSAAGNRYASEHFSKEAPLAKTRMAEAAHATQSRPQPPVAGAAPPPVVAPSRSHRPLPPEQPVMVAALPQPPTEHPEERLAEGMGGAYTAGPQALRMMKAAAPASIAEPTAPGGAPEASPALDFTVADLPAAEDAVRRIAHSLGAHLDTAPPLPQQSDGIPPGRAVRTRMEGNASGSPGKEAEVRIVAVLIPANRFDALRQELAKGLLQLQNRFAPENKGAGRSFGGSGGASPTIRVLVRLHPMHAAPSAPPSSKDGASSTPSK